MHVHMYARMCMHACINRKRKQMEQEVGFHVCFSPRIYTELLESSLHKNKDFKQTDHIQHCPGEAWKRHETQLNMQTLHVD